MKGEGEMRFGQKRRARRDDRRVGSATPQWTRRLRIVACSLAVLVVGVAGSASAAALIGSRQVKDGSLTGRDLKLGTVRSSDVRDHSLQPQDFGVIPQGPVGIQGDPGDRGASGSPGLGKRTGTVRVVSNETRVVGLSCLPGQKAIAGSASPIVGVQLLQSGPAFDGSSWGFVLRNFNGLDEDVAIQAWCVTDR